MLSMSPFIVSVVLKSYEVSGKNAIPSPNDPCDSSLYLFAVGQNNMY